MKPICISSNGRPFILSSYTFDIYEFILAYHINTNNYDCEDFESFVVKVVSSLNFIYLKENIKYPISKKCKLLYHDNIRNWSI